MVAARIETLLWRNVAGVTELTRMLAREGFLWCSPNTVSQQAISQRFLTVPFDTISLEMIYRGLYHFSVAHQKGLASDPVKYFASPENQDLGIVKKRRKPNVKLIVAPFPDKLLGCDQFFFQTSSKIPLTTGLQP